MSVLSRAHALGMAGVRRFQQGGPTMTDSRRETQKEADNQRYWLEMAQDLGVLPNEVLRRLAYNPEFTSKPEVFKRQVVDRGAGHIKAEDFGRDLYNPSLLGATDTLSARKRYPGLYVNYPSSVDSERPGAQVSETINHELGHIALSPINQGYRGRKDGASPSAMEEILLRAIARQVTRDQKYKEEMDEEMNIQKERLTNYGRGELGEYGKIVGKYIDELQGSEKMKSIPYRKVDTAVMQKEANKFKKGGLATIAAGFTGGNQFGIGALVPFKNKAKMSGIKVSRAPSIRGMPK